jgi:prevent-host-death family protein
MKKPIIIANIPESVVQYCNKYSTTQGKEADMQVTISQLKANLKEYVESAVNGEDVLITRYGKPIAKIQGINKDIATFAELRGIIQGDPTLTRKELIGNAIAQKEGLPND